MHQMIRRSGRFFSIAILSFFVISLLPATAADDPNIPAKTKEKVLTALTAHIQSVQAKHQGSFPVLDFTQGKVIDLTLEKVHAGVVKKGDDGFFVSCADFRGKDRVLYDLDFLVDENFEVVLSFLHKKDGKKYNYEVE